MGLILLYAFTALSIAGFATFGLHPEWLNTLDPGAVQFYSISFRFFATGQVLIAGAAMIAFLIRHAGWKWITPFVALYSLSLISELLGTTYGIPFGAYSYSAVLKPMWLDRVPVGIPLSWFYMALPSYAIASRLLRNRENPALRIGIASFILLAWDLALDPAMSSATKYWEWGESGPYYGMPLLNLFGWYVTGIMLMCALIACRADTWIARLPIKWLAGFYGANLLLALGISVAAQRWLALLFTATALLIVSVASSLLDRDIAIASADPLPEPR
jgi:putative membrane protein